MSTSQQTFSVHSRDEKSLGEEKRTSTAPVYSDVSISSSGRLLQVARLTTTSSALRELSESETSCIISCVRAMFTLLELFGYKPTKKDKSEQRTCDYWLSAVSHIADADGWMKFAKWKFADLFFHLGQEAVPEFLKDVIQPPAPPKDLVGTIYVDHHTIFCSGRAGKFVRSHILHSKHKDAFCASILQLKKGCARPSQDLVDASVRKTVATLIKDHSSDVMNMLIEEYKSYRSFFPNFGYNIDDVLSSHAKSGEDLFLVQNLWDEAKELTQEYKLETKFVERKEFTPQQEMLEVKSAVSDSFSYVFERPEFGKKLTVNKELMLNQIHRTVKELFENKNYNDFDKIIKPRFPTTKSTFTHNQGQGGGVLAIREFAQSRGFVNPGGKSLVTIRTVSDIRSAKSVILEKRRIRMAGVYFEPKVVINPDSKEPINEDRLDEYIRLVESFKKYDRYNVHQADANYSYRSRTLYDQKGRIVEPKDESNTRGDWKYPKSGDRQFEYTADASELRKVYSKLHFAMLKAASSSDNIVTPKGLAEALKVRVITKGSALAGHVLRPLQKFMHSTLREHPTFELIGKPVNPWIIQNRMGARLNAGEFYLSGDYSAATDNLDPELSAECLLWICQYSKVSKAETALALQALTGHKIGYYDDKGKYKTDVLYDQKWGQLMGSIVSFPILCIVNAALCRWVLEYDCKFSRIIKLHDAALLINGDDCALRCTSRGLTMWKLLATASGLTPSIGKFFFSREFVQINSENFKRLDNPRIDKDPISGKFRPMHFETTPFFNLGLFFGLKRSGGMEESGGTTKGGGDSAGSRFKDFIKCAPTDFKESAYMKYLFHHWDKFCGVRVPWFVPEAYGGLGLPCLLEYKEAPELMEFPEGPDGTRNYEIMLNVAESTNLYKDVRMLTSSEAKQRKVSRVHDILEYQQRVVEQRLQRDARIANELRPIPVKPQQPLIFDAVVDEQVGFKRIVSPSGRSFLCGPSRTDRLCVARLLQDPSKYPVGPIPKEPNWKVHQMVLDRTKSLNKQPIVEDSPQSAEYDKVYSLLTVDLLFTALSAKDGDDSLFVPELKKKSGVLFLRRNEHSWSKLNASLSKDTPDQCSVRQIINPSASLSQPTIIESK